MRSPTTGPTGQLLLPDAAPLLAVWFASVALLVLAHPLIAYWVYRDAAARGSDRAGQWGVGVLLLSLVAVAYVFRRDRLGERRTKTARERAVETVVLATLAAWAAGAVLAPPDPFTVPLVAGAAFAAALPVAYVLAYRDGVSRVRERLSATR